MNQTFNIHRFVLMLRLDWAEKGRNAMLMAAVLLFCMVAMMLPIALSDEYSSFREVLHYFALVMVVLFGGSLYTNTAFSQYSSPGTGIAALMIPASRLEKFLSSLLLNLAFVIPFIIFFWQFHYFIFDIANEKLPVGVNKYRYIAYDLLLYLTYSYFIIQAVVFWGSIFFRKASYIKTAAIFLGFVFVVACVNYILAARLTNTPSKLTAFPLTGWKLWYYPQSPATRPEYMAGFYHLTFPAALETAVQAFAVLLALLIWTSAYFQMKEREI